MYIREFIMALLLINACFYISKQVQLKMDRPGHPQTQEVTIKGVGYLLVNILFISITFLM